MEIDESQQIVKEIFEKYGISQPCFDGVHRGFHQYLKNDSPRSHVHDKSTKVHLVNSYVNDEFLRLIASNEFPMRWNNLGNNRTIIIADRIIARPKKIGDGFTTKNQPTKIVKAYRNHETEKIIKSATKLIPVDIAWSLDDFIRNILGVYLLCPKGDDNLWVTPFYLVGAADAMIFPVRHFLQVNMPSVEERTGEIQKTATAKIKKGLGKKKDKDNDGI
jgi:hypothetical protein